jgi:hypothetical protein
MAGKCAGPSIVVTTVVLVLLALATRALSLSGLTPSMATLDQNGYSNVVVSISDQVPDEDCHVLLSNLKVSPSSFSLYP